MKAPKKETILSAFIAVFLTTSAYLVNLASSFSSFANDATSLIADKLSSTSPPSFFVSMNLAIAAALALPPNIPMTMKISGK